MSKLDSVIDYLAVPFLNRYKYNLYADKLNLRSLYEQYISSIQTLHATAYYWHGTGKYHYRHLGESKYHSKATKKIDNVLNSLIKEGGLKPHYDFWTKLTSVSLSKNRMYARAYAQFHQYEKEPLDYQYGTIKFWFFIVAIKQLFTNNPIYNLKRITALNSSADFNKQFQDWASYVRKDTDEHPVTLLSLYQLRSDIPNNYGLLFGIKKSAVKELHFNPAAERFEIRNTEPISFKQMTHVEVPLKHLSETKTVFNKSKINLPIIPIELAELYCNTQSIRHLAR